MDQKIVKPQWNRPQLIVLGRGRPEEAVLAACKSSRVSRTGWSFVYENCFRGLLRCTTACQTNSAS